MVEVSLTSGDLVTKDSRLSRSCGMKPSFVGHTGPGRPKPVPGRRHRDAPHPRQACAPGWLRKGRWGWGRSFRPRASPSRPRRRPHCMSHSLIEDLLSLPGLRSPPDDCGENAAVWRTTQSSIGKYVLDGSAGDDKNDGRRASGEELRLRTAPATWVGARARRPRRPSLAPTGEPHRSCSLSSSSPSSPRCPQQHPGSRRRRHHRRRHRSAPRSRSRHRLLRHRPPPRPEHRPPP